MKRVRACVLLFLSMVTWTASATDSEQSWRFRVWLDDKEIGYHEFTLERGSGQERLRIEARFEVRLLFMTVYEYLHQNVEVWENGCLSRIESHTDANGETFVVRGARQRDRFGIDRGTGIDILPDCVKTFSYWDPGFLEESALLNAQTGEWVDIEVSPPVPERLSVGGRETEANRYRVRAGEATLDLWYSEGRDWLALESETAGGRRLRYERM